MSDSSATEIYRDPENRRAVGSPQRRRVGSVQLSNHVTIRFSAATISLIRALAGRAGMSVGTWIRAVVEREIERQLALPKTGSGSTAHAWLQALPARDHTANPSYVDREPDVLSLV